MVHYTKQDGTFKFTQHVLYKKSQPMSFTELLLALKNWNDALKNWNDALKNWNDALKNWNDALKNWNDGNCKTG